MERLSGWGTNEQRLQGGGAMCERRAVCAGVLHAVRRSRHRQLQGAQPPSSTHYAPPAGHGSEPRTSSVVTCVCAAGQGRFSLSCCSTVCRCRRHSAKSACVGRAVRYEGARFHHQCYITTGASGQSPGHAGLRALRSLRGAAGAPPHAVVRSAAASPPAAGALNKRQPHHLVSSLFSTR